MGIRSKKLLSLVMAACIISSSLGSLKASASPTVGTGVKGKPRYSKSQMLEEIVKDNFKSKDGVLQISSKPGKAKESDDVNPNKKVKFIVQLDEKSVKDYASTSVQSLQQLSQDKNLVNKVTDVQEKYKTAIKKLDTNIKFKQKYSLLMNGFSFEGKYGDLEKIKALPGVKKVSIANTYYTNMNSAKELGNVIKVWENNKYKGQGLAISVIDTGIDVNNKDMKISEGVDVKFSEEDINQMNAKLQNPKGKYFNKKIPYGFNFADNTLQVVPTENPHGVHVAGIIGANCQSDEEVNTYKGIRGVAPEAQLFAMKVFSNSPGAIGCTEDDVVAAIEDSVAHGADIINMSLGAEAISQDPNTPQQTAVREAVEQGTIVVCAAGNSTNTMWPVGYKGIKDTGIVGEPSVAKEAISVASYENDKMIASTFSYKIPDGENGLLSYFQSNYPAENITTTLKGQAYNIIDCGIGKRADVEGKDLTGKIALIKRGGVEDGYGENSPLRFFDKVINAQNAGAIAVIIWNQSKAERPDSGGEVLDGMDTDNCFVKVPAVGIGNLSGLKLLDAIQKGVTVSFDGGLTSIDNGDKGSMSDYSSWGTTQNLEFKPEISGIGGDVYSTVLNNQYKSLSGTSMASPFVAGVMALISQSINEAGISFATPKDKVQLAKTLAINTTVVKMDKEHPEVPYSPRRQGAGLIDAKAAVDNKVTVTYNGEATAALKEMGSTTEFTMKLHNYGKTDVTYMVKDLSGVLTNVDKDYLPGEMPYDIKMQGAAITFSTNEVTVKAGEEAQVKATITMDGTSPIDNFAEGFIRFVPTTENTPEIGMAYMGFYGDWDGLSIIDAPIYDKDSHFKSTNLYTTRQNDVDPSLIDVLSLVDKNAKKENYGFNPDLTYHNNVAPGYTFLRNAKYLNIDITDANNNLVRTVCKDDIQQKIILGSLYEGDKPAKVDERAWVWDGKVFDSKTAKFVSVPEGQYYVNGRTAIDCENAKEQVVTMPVRIDKTAPKATVVNDFRNITNAGKFKFQFKVEDNGPGATGFKNCVFYVDGNKYYDENYKTNFSTADLEYDPNTGVYSKEMNFEEWQYVSQVTVAVIDYAGNPSLSDYIYVYYQEQLDIQMPITYDRPYYELGQDVTFNFDIPSEVLDKAQEVEIMYYNWDTFEYVWSYIDKATITEKNGKLSYTIKNGEGLQGGNTNLLFVKVYDDRYNTLIWECGDIDVNAKDFYVNFDNLYDYAIFSTNKPTIYGKVSTNNYKSLKINGQEVKLGAEGFGGFNRRAFKQEIELQPAKLNKVLVELVDKNDKVTQYSYKVVSDNKAPVITLTNPVSKENDIKLYVDNKTTTYTIKGTVSDDGFGYDLTANGEGLAKAYTEIPGTAKTKAFEYTVPLNEGSTIVKLVAKDTYTENTITKTITIIKSDKPVFNSIAIDKTNIKLGDVATVTINASTPGASLANKATVNYVRLANGKVTEEVKPLTLSLTNGKYIGKINFDNTWRSGVWRIKNISIKDTLGQETLVTNPELNAAIDYTFGRYSFTISQDVTRYGGADRFETAVKVSKAGWAKSQNVVITNAYGFADSLAGVPFAYLKDAPILLTDINSIPKATDDEITRLGAKNIYILGGTGVVSQKVENELKNKHFNVVRLAGADRFETGIKVANQVMKNNPSKTAVLATAYDFPDALAISPYAAMKQYPILYTETNTLNAKSKAFIKENGITKIIIPGGVGAVSEAVANELKNSGITVERVAGADRYTTALNIAKKYKDTFKNEIMLSYGNDFPDALVGGILAAKKQVPILLVETNFINAEVRNYIRAKGNINMYILGGTGVISNNVINLIN